MTRAWRVLLLDLAAAFFFRSDQRFFVARPIFLRAAADRRRLRPSGLPAAVLPRLSWLFWAARHSCRKQGLHSKQGRE